MQSTCVIGSNRMLDGSGGPPLWLDVASLSRFALATRRHRGLCSWLDVIRSSCVKIYLFLWICFVGFDWGWDWVWIFDLVLAKLSSSPIWIPISCSSRFGVLFFMKLAMQCPFLGGEQAMQCFRVGVDRGDQDSRRRTARWVLVLVHIHKLFFYVAAPLQLL
jgi:hypothetical protein